MMNKRILKTAIILQALLLSVQARAQALIRNTEKLLGVEEGSLAGSMARLFRPLF